MFFIEELWEILILDRLMSKPRVYTDFLFRSQSASKFNATCQSAELEACRDDSAAFSLKFVAMASILVAGIVGIAIPLVGKHRKFLRTDGSLFVAAKAFAAGVILATGFVHMLPGGTTALSDPCLPEYPWSKFPFAGFFCHDGLVGDASCRFCGDSVL